MRIKNVVEISVVDMELSLDRDDIELVQALYHRKNQPLAVQEFYGAFIDFIGHGEGCDC